MNEIMNQRKKDIREKEYLISQMIKRETQYKEFDDNFVFLYSEKCLPVRR
jgi:hypothetical protein